MVSSFSFFLLSESVNVTMSFSAKILTRCWSDGAPSSVYSNHACCFWLLQMPSPEGKCEKSVQAPRGGGSGQEAWPWKNEARQTLLQLLLSTVRRPRASCGNRVRLCAGRHVRVGPVVSERTTPTTEHECHYSHGSWCARSTL